MKYSTEQKKLLQDFFAAHPHEIFSAKEIASSLGEKNVSISAVYRNLSDLENAGVVRRCAKTGCREAYYQYITAEGCREHIHLSCRSCGKSFHMSVNDTEKLIRTTMEHSSFLIDKTETVLFGICEACQKA